MNNNGRTGTKVVTKIAANPELSKRHDPNRVLKVAAYCRVSTDAEDQLNSYRTQKTYYTELIKKNPKWRFAGIYADATDIIGLKQNPTNGRRFSPIFSFIGHLSE